MLWHHRDQLAAIVAALLVHRTLNPVELLDLWERGAFAFTGRIGQVPLVPTRRDIATWPCPLTTVSTR